MAEPRWKKSDLSYFPPVGFHFRVNGAGTGQGEDIDIAFQSVSGLNVQLQTETVKEGGENRYEHTLPVRSKYSDLVLKRGVVVSGQSELTRWFHNAFHNFEFKGKDLTVELLNEKQKPLMFWKVINALPKNWKFADMNAERGEILIETMELSYSYFEFKDP
jgi:phage tail-like protein